MLAFRAWFGLQNRSRVSTLAMEHRCSPRTACNYPATVKPRAGRHTPCVIRNVSHDGMLLRTGDAQLAVGEVVQVGLLADATSGEVHWVRAMVVHSRTGYAGIWLDEKDDHTHRMMLGLCDH